MNNYRLLPVAYRELERAYLWYLRRSPNTADRFEAAVQAALSNLARFPGIGHPVDRRHRRIDVLKFPYGLIYRIDPDGTITVIAVAHNRRRFGYWRQR